MNSSTKRTSIKVLALTGVAAVAMGATALTAGPASAGLSGPTVFPPQVNLFQVRSTDQRRTQVTFLYTDNRPPTALGGAVGYVGHLLCLNGTHADQPVLMQSRSGIVAGMPAVVLPSGTICEAWVSTPAGRQSRITTLSQVNDAVAGYDWVYASGSIS